MCIIYMCVIVCVCCWGERELVYYMWFSPLGGVGGVYSIYTYTHHRGECVL